MDSQVLKRTLKSLSGGLRELANLLNEKVGPLLARHDRELARHQEDILTLYELSEMTPRLLMRAQIEGVFEGLDPADEEAVEASLLRVQALQDEYLATLSLAVFLSSLGEPTE